MSNANLIDVGRIEETKANRSEVAHLAMPSNRYIELTLGPSESAYVAPADGYFCVGKISTNNNQYINLWNEETLLVEEFVSNFNGQQCKIWLPAKKGQIIRCAYNVGGNNIFFRFIYAEGSY